MKNFIIGICLSIFGTLAYASNVVPLYVTVGPGTASDTIARAVAELYNKRNTGITIVVENVPGGKGQLAVNRFIESIKPALLLGSTSVHVINPVLEPTATYQVSDFDFVGIVGWNPTTFYVDASLPVNSAKDLLAYIRGSKDIILIAVDTSLGEANIKSMIKKHQLTNVRIVNYKTSLEAFRDVIGGRIKIAHAATNPTLLETAKQGKIRFIGTSWHKTTIINDITILPMNEHLGLDFLQGMAAISFNKNFGSDKEQIRKDLVSVLDDPTLHEKIKQFGSYPGMLRGQEVIKNITESQDMVRKAYQ